MVLRISYGRGSGSGSVVSAVEASAGKGVRRRGRTINSERRAGTIAGRVTSSCACSHSRGRGVGRGNAGEKLPGEWGRTSATVPLETQYMSVGAGGPSGRQRKPERSGVNSFWISAWEDGEQGRAKEMGSARERAGRTGVTHASPGGQCAGSMLRWAM